MPSISIICPVYQAEAYLDRCVQSILAQTFTDFELVLVDDGSRDRSGEMCDEYARKDSRVHAYHKPNGGLCSARNMGLDHISGEYSVHVDPDDWLEPTMLEELYAKAKADDADMVICDIFINRYGKQYYSKQEPEALDHKTVMKGFFHDLHSACWNKLVRRSCYTSRGLRFPDKLYIWEDMYFNASLCMEDIKIVYLNKAFYHYDCSSNPNSLVRTCRPETVESQKWVISHFEHILSDPSWLDNLKMGTKERLFYSRLGNGKDLYDLYPEVNETFLSGNRSASIVGRWTTHALRHPSLSGAYRLMLSAEESARTLAGKMKRFFIG